MNKKKLIVSILLGSALFGLAGCQSNLYLGGDITKGKTTVGVGKSTDQNGVSVYIGHRMGRNMDSYATGNYFIDEAIARKQVSVVEATRILPQEIAEVVYKAYNLTPEEISKTKFYGYSIDLNGDGKEEQIVVLSGPTVSGTGGDSMLILEEGAKPDSYKVMQRFTLMRLPIVIGKLKPNQEYADIYVHVSGGGAKPADVCLKYVNGRYQTVNEAEEIKDYASLKDEEAIMLVE